MSSQSDTMNAGSEAPVAAGLRYALVTPARNEEDYIEETIKSVVAQRKRPVKWVIVSDGSTDGTDEVVGRYAAKHDWIELVRLPERRERHFAGKVEAFNAGYARLQGCDYDVIGSIDADISFPDDLFEFLLAKFEANPRLGLAGAPFVENNETYDFRYASTEHVSGACQIFRRECFEDVGGYTPVKGGGIDVIAVLTARMKGWRTQTFPERQCVHYRPMGTAEHGPLKVRFLDGKKDYYLGGHPVWQVFRSAFHFMKSPPGGMMLFLGYLWAMIRRVERPMSKELIRFRRKEQMQRLRGIVGRVLPGGKPSVRGDGPQPEGQS